MLTFGGSGIVNVAINKLPFELHLSGGDEYCGPETRLNERLARGDPGINQFDVACKEHDIAYSKSKNNLSERHKADKILAEKAWSRVKQSSSLKEQLAALLVTGAMKTKTKPGMGIKKKKRRAVKSGGATISFREIVKNARAASVPAKTVREAAKQALAAVRHLVKGRRKRLPPRIIPVPKSGGFLPLVPLFAGLSALGALAGGASGIAKAVNDATAAKKQLGEAARHNQTMEAITLRGRGLYLKH